MAATPARASQSRTLLEELLRRQDYTYEEVAARFEALARDMGESATLTSRHLRRLASGERTGTTPVTRRVLQAMFGLTADELLKPRRAVPDNQQAVSPRPRRWTSTERCSKWPRCAHANSPWSQLDQI